MTQLDLSGDLRHAVAVVGGVFDQCVPHDTRPALSLHETLSLHLGKLAVPAVSGYSFGHIGDQVTLPLGIRARLDTESQTITLLEPAVL